MSIYKRVRDGKASEYYYYKFEYQGKVVRKCAETADKYVAMAREKEARKLLIAGRWSELEKMSMRASGGAEKLGRVLEVYRERATINPETVLKNISALRNICARGFPNRDFETLAAKELNGRLVRNYKNAMLAAAGQNKVELETVKTTINSTYAQARSIFAPRMMQVFKDAELDMGETLVEFRSEPMFQIARRGYTQPPLELLTRLIKMAFVGEGEVKPLRESDPNAYKAFLLGLGLGLRKNGASHARYDWITERKRLPIRQIMLSLGINPEEPTVAPAATKAAETDPDKAPRVLLTRTEDDFQPKGKDETCIPMSDWLFEELTALRVPTVDPKEPQYIIHGHLTERTGDVWRRLSAWMVGLGWDRRMKSHELRKLYGSEVASAFGIYAAQKLLGHKDANLTSSRYADINQLPDVRIFG